MLERWYPAAIWRCNQLPRAILLKRNRKIGHSGTTVLNVLVMFQVLSKFNPKQDQVKINKVTKRFGDVEAVKDFSLEINDGEFIVLVGPSGCGKTTLLRMVAGPSSENQKYFYLTSPFQTSMPSCVSPCGRRYWILIND